MQPTESNRGGNTRHQGTPLHDVDSPCAGACALTLLAGLIYIKQHQVADRAGRNLTAS
jgi:hypothetical protein